ncbi:unnamed protein product [Caenorhabditis brenneri]
MRQLLLNDLKSILINPKLEIGKLAITKDVFLGFRSYFDEFVQLLSSLEHKVHVEYFKWELYYETNQLMETLNAMKTPTLSRLKWTNTTTERLYPFLELKKELFNLPQWKGVKKLNCYCRMDPKNYIYLAQFDKVVLTKDPFTNQGEVKLTGEIIMAMKNKLLENENFDQIIINEKHAWNPVRKLKPILRPFQSPTDPRWAQFDYPNSDKKLLLRVYYGHIWLKGPCYKQDEHEEKDILSEEESEEENEGEEVSDEEEEDPSDMSDQEQED